MRNFRNINLSILFIIILILIISSCDIQPLGDRNFTSESPSTLAARTLSVQSTLSAGLTAIAQLTDQNQPPTEETQQAIRATSSQTPEINTSTPTFTRFPTNTPTTIPTITAFFSSTATPTPEPCNKIGTVQDITVPDGTTLLPGMTFTKIWRLSNAGNCTWTPKYLLVFIRGDRMQAPSYLPLQNNVPPGATIDVSVDLLTPLTAGNYRGYWMLSDGSGQYFGYGDLANVPFWVDIEVRSDQRPFAYDFSGNMCQATWQSNAGILPCPGDRDSPDGSVFLLNEPFLEDGRRENERTLWTRPEIRVGGWIFGSYPPYLVRNNDHFMAGIGCLQGSPSCDVDFTLSYQIAGRSMQTIGTWHEEYDGETTQVIIDLSELTGSNVQFVLGVTNRGNPRQADAFWLVPSIRRLDPTPVPTVTSLPTPTPTILVSPTPTETPDESANEAVRITRRELADFTREPPQNVQIKSVQRVIWDDICFEVDHPDRACAEATITGYKIHLIVQGIEFEARTNQDASRIYWVRNGRLIEWATK